jgi:hypothetical protein
MGATLIQQVKTDGTRLRTLGANAMTKGLLRVIGH